MKEEGNENSEGRKGRGEAGNPPNTHYAYFLSICVKSPSLHSLVLGSNTPYKSSLEMALGSIMCATPSTPSRRSRAFRSTLQAVDLPLPLGPTNIRPWCSWVIW